jgi:hypothetical protein
MSIGAKSTTVDAIILALLPNLLIFSLSSPHLTTLVADWLQEPILGSRERGSFGLSFRKKRFRFRICA